MRGAHRLSTVLAAATLLLSTAAAAHALSMLDFATIGGGSITYAGGASPVVGSNIGVGTVTQMPGGLTVACVGCVLDFTSDNLVSYDAASGHWVFGGGPNTSITITGSVPLANASGVLLSGTFSTVDVFAFGTNFKLVAGGITDTKDPNLLSFFGLPAGTSYNGSLAIGFQAVAQTGGAFSSSVITGGDIATNTTAPEPGTILLLGSGLAGSGLLARRRQRVRR